MNGLSIAGLVVNMWGMVAAFFFGFPQPDLRGDAILMEVSPDPDALARLRSRRRLLSYVAVLLMFVGFSLQLAGALAE